MRHTTLATWNVRIQRPDGERSIKVLAVDRHTAIQGGLDVLSLWQKEQPELWLAVCDTDTDTDTSESALFGPTMPISAEGP